MLSRALRIVSRIEMEGVLARPSRCTGDSDSRVWCGPVSALSGVVRRYHEPYPLGRAFGPPRHEGLFAGSKKAHAFLSEGMHLAGQALQLRYCAAIKRRRRPAPNIPSAAMPTKASEPGSGAKN